MAATVDESGPHSAAVLALAAQEQAVGISAFVRPDAQPFQCVVKQRYTDFLVNEILPNGKVLHLVHEEPSAERKRKRGTKSNAEDARKKVRTEEDVANDDVDATVSAKENGTGDEPNNGVHEVSNDGGNDAKAVKAAAAASIKDEDRAILAGFFGDSVASSIIDLYASTIAYPNRKVKEHPTVISEPFAEKSRRTEAHTAIRKIFGANKLESTTVQDQEHKSGPGTVISIKATPARGPVDPNKDDDKQRGKIVWSDLGGEFLHFSLYKENKDTMEILYFVASQLKLNIKHFSFAGTKDRRGVTVQRVAVHRIKRERLEGLNRIARGFRLVGPWEYKPKGLELGLLAGNEFVLTLRDVYFPDEQATWGIVERRQHAERLAQAAAASLGELGFLNYFGLQRFGTHSIGTHSVGMKMLKGDLKGAVDDILSYDPELAALDGISNQDPQASEKNSKASIPQDDINRAKAIHAFRSGAKTYDALHYLPGARFSAEKSIITYLGKRDAKNGTHPNATDFQGALLQIQRNLRLMYVHAYQSFIWNTIAGKRWELHGSQVIEGDLVLVGEKERAEGVANGNRVPKEEVDEAGEPIIHPSASAVVGADDATLPALDEYDDDPFVRARPLTKEEAESGRFTIFDVVLPLPGHDIIYPANPTGKLYEEVMESEAGGGLDPHNMRRTWREISLPGGYRKMMARPLGGVVEVEVKSYHGPDAQLVQTELQRLELEDRDALQGGKLLTSDAGTVDAEEADKIALVIKLQLGSSQYATMALRELTRGGAVGFRPEFSVVKR